MKTLILLALMVLQITLFGSHGFCSIAFDENYENGKNNKYIDDTGGTMTFHSTGGNTYAQFTIGTGYDPDYYENGVSSLIFYEAPVDEWTSVLSFDYNFTKSIALPEGFALNEYDFSGADYFSVSMIHNGDVYYLFQHSFDADDLSDVVFSPEGLSFETSGNSLFTHVRLNLTDFLAANSLIGETVDVYFEILNGAEMNYYTNQSLKVPEFTPDVILDNTYMGSVPEPSFYAMFVFGLSVLYQRIRRRLKHNN